MGLHHSLLAMLAAWLWDANTSQLVHHFAPFLQREISQQLWFSMKFCVSDYGDLLAFTVVQPLGRYVWCRLKYCVVLWCCVTFLSCSSCIGSALTVTSVNWRKRAHLQICMNTCMQAGKQTQLCYMLHLICRVNICPSLPALFPSNNQLWTERTEQNLDWKEEERQKIRGQQPCLWLSAIKQAERGESEQAFVCTCVCGICR